jgi:cell division protein FtsZ
VGVVTKPFDWEGGRRMTNADHGLAELEANVDSLIVILNEKLLEVLGDEITQDEAFAHANDVLRNAVGGIAEIINVPGHVNVDFEDVRTVMGEPGKAMMGTAVAEGPDRARLAAEQAVACPLLDGIDLSGARGVLVLISAAKGMLKLSESKLAMNTIRAYAAADAHVIYGTAYDDSLGDQVRVTVVATGLSRQGQRRPPMTVIRTGTDNGPVGYGPATPGLSSPLGSAFGAMPSVPTLGSPGAGPSASAGGLSAPATSFGSASPASSLSADVNVPSVWRNNRTTAAAKVDALAAGGMDDLEIPAVLRRQAD